jgi:ABC-type multidrug transport system fused ATPase/permease subunit
LKQIVKNTLAILNYNERKKFGALIILDILISIADIGSLALLIFTIQFYTQPSSTNFSFLPDWMRNSNSLLPIIAFLLLFSLKNLAGFIIYRSQCKFLCQVSSRISQKMLKEYLEGPFSNYVNIDSAIHIRKINHQSIEFSHHILGGIQQIITQLVLIIFSITAILLFKARIFLLLLIILLPPVIAVFYLLKKKLSSAKIYMKKSSDKSLQHLQEALTGFVESNIYNKNNFFLQRYATYQEKFNNYHSDLLVAQGIPSRMIEIFALVGLFFLIAFSKWTGNADSTMIVTIGAFMAAAYKIIPGIVKILNINGQIQTYSHTVYDLVESNKTIDANHKKNGVKSIRSIQFKNVSFRYKDEFLFSNLNLNIKQGDFLGISGLSGKGKTTILNLLLGFLHPDSGEIIVNDIPANTMVLQQYWPAISYVKQQTFLIHDTITQNITLSNEPVDEKKLKEVINTAGLAELIDTFPEGVNKVIMENGKNLSGGQRQRIAIARALYKNADFIILDEPFNELDEKSEQCLLNHFKNLSETGKLILLITHDKKSLSFCTKILSLDEQ